MPPNITRRTWLRGSLATAAVVAYDPVTKLWATALSSGALAIPELDGDLVLSGPLLDEAAADFGHIVSKAPVAVLIPGSKQDVARVVKFARNHDLKVGGMSMIGNTHSTFGQSQVEAGVVIDMAALSQIHAINTGDALVDAGVRWIDLLAQTVLLGKSPPTLPDYIDLSVGGTLSLGGIGGQAHRHGFIVDNVLELEVVTGQGNLVTCSPSERPGLFNAVRAGLGQFAIIVGARVRLVEVPAMVRTYTAVYAAIPTFTRDEKRLITEERFDYVEGFAFPGESGGWVFQLEVAKYFEPGDEPDDGALLSGLSFIPGTEARADASYFDFANRLAPVVELLIQLGLWQAPHPWFNMFVPESTAATAIQQALDVTPPDELNLGPVLIYPFRRSKLTAPFSIVPDEEISYLFALLRNAVPDARVPGLLTKNRVLFEALRDVGAKRYPIGSVPFDSTDWVQHYGARWLLVALAKLLFDPKNTLTPGQGIFSS